MVGVAINIVLADDVDDDDENHTFFLAFTLVKTLIVK